MASLGGYVSCPVLKFVSLLTNHFVRSRIVTIVVILALSCCESVRRTSPQNFIALFIFTLAESFLVGVISSMYYWKIVLTAVVITAVICFALTLFAFQTKIDFTVYNGLLFVLCLVLMLFGIITMFWKDSIVHLIYACFGALLFSAVSALCDDYISIACTFLELVGLSILS